MEFAPAIRVMSPGKFIGGGVLEVTTSPPNALRSGVFDAIKLSIENGFGIRVWVSDSRLSFSKILFSIFFHHCSFLRHEINFHPILCSHLVWLRHYTTITFIRSHEIIEMTRNVKKDVIVIVSAKPLKTNHNFQIHWGSHRVGPLIAEYKWRGDDLHTVITVTTARRMWTLNMWRSVLSNVVALMHPYCNFVSPFKSTGIQSDIQ